MKPEPTGLRAATTPVLFATEELWFLQGAVRHEMQGQRDWQKPPADLDLNDMIADAILSCEEHSLPGYTLLLTMHHCLIIDATVPAAAKTALGNPMGKPILMKSYRARRALRGGTELAAEEPKEKVNVRERMAEFEAAYVPEAEACEHCGRKD